MILQLNNCNLLLYNLLISINVVLIGIITYTLKTFKLSSHYSKCKGRYRI